MRTADVVIVGGGVIGASVAYHLAARGARDVLVLERGAGPGEGSTGVATGGFRASFSAPIDVRLSLLAREELRRFQEDTGVDPGYVPAGYLWLATREKEMTALRAALRVQHDEGLAEAREVDLGEIARLNPFVRLDGDDDAHGRAAVGAVGVEHAGSAGRARRRRTRVVVMRSRPVHGGLFCSTDGFIRPMRILEGYLEAARRLGVRVEWSVEVTGLRRQDDGDSGIEALATRTGPSRGSDGPAESRTGRITTVETTRGPIAAGAVVDAAGAWAGHLASFAEVDLPVAPLRRQVAVTHPFDGLPETMPLTIFAGDGFHFRVRDGRVLLLAPDLDRDAAVAGRVEPTSDTRVDPAWVEAVAETARRRVPVLAGASIDPAACRAGLYEMSPDRHAILGVAPGCENFYLANGSSGHGVMHAPALGLLLAEIMTDGAARSLDVTALRPSRFAEGTVEEPVDPL